jgi:2-polyprenyl-6-methoxyphenol hydroxylase-like FAD-dependent oxidoreductase
VVLALQPAAFPVRNFHARRNVTSIVPSRDGAAAILDDGTRFEGDLLIGAAGMRSVVRRALFRWSSRATLTEDPNADRRPSA